MTDLLEAVLEHVDLDLVAGVACGWEEGCAAEATWHGKHPCCGHNVTLCAEHKWEADELLRTLREESLDGDVCCGLCRYFPMGDYIWRKL